MWLVVLFTIPMIGWHLAVKSHRFRHRIQKPWNRFWSWVFRKNLKRAKPFDCPSCLSFWISIITLIAFTKNSEDVLAHSLVALACYVLGGIYERQMK